MDDRETADPMGHISSVVLRVAKDQEAEVSRAVARLGCEIAMVLDGKIIVIMEAATSGALGSLLAQMTLLDGVHSACMVYEQAEPLERLGEEV